MQVTHYDTKCACGEPVAIYTQGIPKCWRCYPVEPPSVDVDELAELRAYKERTEAALTEFTSELNNYDGVPTNYYKQELRRLGLWREGGA